MVQRAKKTNEPLKNEKGELQLLTSHTLVRPTPSGMPKARESCLCVRLVLP